MRSFNFQLKPYRAECLQWDGANFNDIQLLLDQANKIESSTLHSGAFIMIRHTDGVSTLVPGDWVIKGEDGEVRFYDAALFAAKYEPLISQEA